MSGISDGPSTRGRASSVGRRQTLCSGGGDETPSKSSRREMLAAWRQSRKGGGDDTENKKRIRGHDAPPLPPSFNTSSTTTPAPENGAYQSRKHQRVVENEEPLSLSQNSAPSPSIHYYDDESASEVSRGGISMNTARTPKLRAGKLGSARRRTFLGKSTIQQEGKDSSVNVCVIPYLFAS